ncbi:unnamed protein product [Hydatigera taeniaeformis]|uniref:MHD2 domain-containing protein n=1 Tax=Hydatigena taeniaeformis TaxID=6205 RepID=A0A0R3XAP1_HYDTA|nr:unnamed protein product [Hydatigera taeniaeformis]
MSVLEMGRLLQGCKEPTHSGGVEQMESDCENCLRPLMDYFELVLSAQASSCEKTVLKRLLKELWRITMENTEKLVVLPGVAGTKQVSTTYLSLLSNTTYLPLPENLHDSSSRLSTFLA